MWFRFSAKSFKLLLHSNPTLFVFFRHFQGKLEHALRLSDRGKHAVEVERAKKEFYLTIETLSFSTSWFDGSIPLWVPLLKNFQKQSRKIRILEIGSWEGRSTIFFLSYLKNCEVTAVDTWRGGDEHEGNQNLSEIEQRFDENLKKYMTRINKIKGKSDIVLPQLTSDNYEKFDIVFIDGSHYADDVLSDAINAWRLLALNGVIIFDDYLWRAEKYGWKKNPANGVNLFLRLVQDDYQLLHLGHQCAIKKINSIDKYRSI